MMFKDAAPKPGLAGLVAATVGWSFGVSLAVAAVILAVGALLER